MANYTARKVHKQMYPGTYNFKDEADGTSGTDIDFVDNATTGANTTAQIIALNDGHRKVLEMYDNDGGALVAVSDDFTAQTSGTVEFWVKTSDATPHTFIQLYEGGSLRLYFAIRVENLYHHTGAAWSSICAISDNIWYHIRIDFDVATDTFDLWVNGIQYENGTAFYSNATQISNFKISTGTAESGYYAYLDAIGYSWDTSYSIGDNVHWRHYADQDSDCENADWGDTSLTGWTLDGGAGSASIEVDFSAHKKYIQLYDNDGADASNAGIDANANKDFGWVEYWFRTSDATLINDIMGYNSDWSTVFGFRIDADDFEDLGGGAWSSTPNVGTPSDDIWYHVLIIWNASGSTYMGVADNKFRVYVNNISSGDLTVAAPDKGVRYFYFRTDSVDSGYYYDIDAVSFSWSSGNELADNRTFNYLAYTYDDITTDLFAPVVIEEERNKWRTATLRASGDLTFNALYILQLYDGNGALRFEGNFIKKDSDGLEYVLTFHDLSKTALENQASRVASAAESIDDTVRALITYVGQAADNSARLQYYTEHDPAGTFVPMFHNRPLMYITRRLGELKDTNFIVKPNGVCFFDNDRSSGYTITEATGEILKVPKVRSIDTQINKVTIYGNVDPDTGTPFSGSAENTTAQADGTGVVEFWRRVIGLSSATDCTTLATAYLNGTLNPYRVYVPLRAVYCIAGETMSFAYSHLSFAATTMYIERVTYNLVEAGAVYTLSEGIIDKTSIEEEQHMQADATTDDILYTLYTTDIVTLNLPLREYGGGTAIAYHAVQLNAAGEQAMCNLAIKDNVDADRSIYITWNLLIMANAGDGHVNVTPYISRGPINCTAVGATVVHNTAADLDCTTAGARTSVTKEITSSDIDANTLYYITFILNDGAPADLYVFNCIATYYIKRSL